MAHDYSDIPAAVREETIDSLRTNYEAAAANAAEHRAKAEHYQRAADQEKHFADRDEERARQWKAQLDFAEQLAAPVDTIPSPSVADIRAVFGEPVEGRDYDTMPDLPEGGVH